jgi:hypothetical protein
MLDWFPREWIPAVTSSTILAILSFISATYYKAKVEKSIQHKLDNRLESARSVFRKEEEALRADLRTKGEQIAALRSGPLSGLASRFAAIDKRRLEAIDKLWSAVVKNSQFKMAAKMTATIKMEVALDSATRQDSEGAKLREFATVIWNACGLENLKEAEAPDKERPFVTPLAWAVFSAHRLVLAHPVAQLAALRAGVGAKLLADPKPMLDLVKTALPHQASFIEKFGTNGLTLLIDELEETLLSELQRSMHSPDADQANIEQAAAILKAADKLAESTQQTVKPPASVAV